MTAEPDLLPCPFCGSENIDPKGWASTNSAGPACDDCGASAGGVSGTLQDNIARWNTRANVSHATAAKNAKIEALRAEVDLRDSVIATHAEDTREYQKRISQAEARAERLAEALRWALPLASQGLEMCRLERLRCGHRDITGTYKNGETWVGIHQEEVDGMERARAALEQESNDA